MTMKPNPGIVSTLLVAAVLATYSNAPADDFETVKGRVVDELLRPGVDDAAVEGILEIMNDDGSFQGIDYEDLSREAGFPHGRHTRNLVHMARAYRTEASRFHRDRDLKDKIALGFKFWVEHDFVGRNWHNNQVTTPTNLVNLMLLVGDELPDDHVELAQPMIRRATLEREEGVFYGARPGGDRIAIAGIVAKNLLFVGDREEFARVIEIIGGEIKFTTGQRGMQHDFSFHHRSDRINNTTDYGYGKYANAFGEWSHYVAGTEYQFPEDRINHLVDYYLDGICKQLVYGVYRDIGVYNRSITGQRSSSPRGTREIERLLSVTDYRNEELTNLMRLRRGEEAPIRSFAKFFWQTEHFVFQRPHFYTSVRMHSTRNMTMEVPYNGPGIVTHHRADGANYLLLEGNEYDAIWPVYDWQKVSGTTIMQKPQRHVDRGYGGNLPVRMKGLTDFVGGVTDGLYGAVAYDFKSPHDRLEARKSWFFFDDEYVCLGAGIHSPHDLPAFTTVNQVLMSSETTVMQDGRIRVLPQGRRDLDQVKWVHEGDVGYIMPEATTVHLSNQPEQGTWAAITAQKNISEELVTRDVFLLGFHHGIRPGDETYQYIVVPGIGSEEMPAASADNRSIEILANTPEVQAVRHGGMEICQLAFYQAGEVTIAEGVSVTMDSQGMAMLKMDGDRIDELTVADPSRELTTITLTVPGSYSARGDDFVASPNPSENRTSIVIDLPRDVYAGKSVTIRL